MERNSIANLSVYRKRQVASARTRWRDAARVVSARWDAFLESEAQTRAFAFKSFVSALDAEEAAAKEMARLFSRTPSYRAAA
jgi:hypothetical protein